MAGDRLPTEMNGKWNKQKSLSA